MAIDRKELLDKAFFGVGTVGYGTIAPSHFAYDANFKPFEKPDPDGAKKLVQDVGKGPLSFEFLVPSGDPATAAAGAADPGAAHARPTSTRRSTQLEFAQILKQQADHVFKGMTYVGWSGRIDPDGNTYDFNYTGRPNNDGSYSNKDVDKLLDDQRADDRRGEAQGRAAQGRADLRRRRSGARLVPLRRGADADQQEVQGLQPYPDQIPRFQFASLAK